MKHICKQVPQADHNELTILPTDHTEADHTERTKNVYMHSTNSLEPQMIYKNLHLFIHIKNIM